MHQLPALIWNQIAAEQPLKTAFAKRLFPLSQEKLDAALELETARLKEQGVSDPLVRASLLLVGPFLWENEAIQAFAQDHPEHQSALPNLEESNEAVMMASGDSPLNTSQQQQLSRLLQTPPA
jgi:hypothetical protein